MWLGSHVSGFDNYTKKVGEYRKFDESLLPEFGVTYDSYGPLGAYKFKGYYYDEDNMFGRGTAKIGGRFNSSFQFRSQTRQLGQDLLANLEARELVNGNPGGKILTHELTDSGADYNYARREFKTNIDYLISKKNQVKLQIAHRSILLDGNRQSIASDHCFSCHATSSGVKVDQQSHEVKAGLQAVVKQMNGGYSFTYRQSKSNESPPQALYDEAKHPVTGGAGAEFGSRMIYNDTVQAYSSIPKIERFSHKVRLNGNVGSGRVAGALSYTKSKNKNTGLSANAWSGSARYAVRLSPKTRLVAKFTGTRLTADDPFIELPIFRDGRPGFTQDFSFTRYSSLDRTDGRATVEVISRLSRKTTVSLATGLRIIDRDDYPVVGDGTVTKRFTAQAKLRYHKGAKYSSALKYRFEKTSDPFISGRGLLEANGSQILKPLGADGFVFYFQREDLRYQGITTEPTDYHEVTWNSNWRVSNKSSVNLGLRGTYDKNNDLGDLNVEHFTARPSVSFTVSPNSKWIFSSGYDYYYNKSTGPVAVALLDG